MGGKDDRVHRLTNFDINEVSLVDRAANKRSFVVTKREANVMSNVLRPDGNGGFRRLTKAEEDEETAKAATAAAPVVVSTVKTDDEDGDMEKAKKLLEAAGLTKQAALLVKVDHKGMAIAHQVAGMAKDLGDVSESMKAEEADEPSDVHMKKMADVHKCLSGIVSKCAKADTTSPAVVAPAAAPAVPSFKASLESIASVLAPFMGVGSHGPKPGDPQVTPPGFNAKNPSDAPGNAAGAAAIKSAAEIENETLKAENALLKKSVNGSTSGSPGERPPVVRDIAWATDMNSPAERKKTADFRDGH